MFKKNSSYQRDRQSVEEATEGGLSEKNRYEVIQEGRQTDFIYFQTLYNMEKYTYSFRWGKH